MWSRGGGRRGPGTASERRCAEPGEPGDRVRFRRPDSIGLGGAGAAGAGALPAAYLGVQGVTAVNRASGTEQAQSGVCRTEPPPVATAGCEDEAAPCRVRVGTSSNVLGPSRPSAAFVPPETFPHDGRPARVASAQWHLGLSE